MPAAAPAGADLAAESADSAPAVRLTGITRSYGGRSVWAPLDLTVLPGTLTVVTGANGSGKTTLLRLVAGLARPSTGRREVPGSAVYLRGGAGLRSAQVVRDAVRSAAALAGAPDGEVDGALKLLGAGHLAARRVGTLSAGERVRAALAAAVAARPAVLCLDEPTAALDAPALHDLAGVLSRTCRRGTAVLVATHQPAVLLPAADAHLRLDGGRLVAA